LTAGPEDVARSAHLRRRLGNLKRVEALPFHQGRFKWERLGLRYTLADVEPPAAEATERACALWRAAGLHAN